MGIAIGPVNLEVAVVRARPSGPFVVASVTVRDFRARPAAEWGAEILRALDAVGEKHLAATVLLPRGETIVRTLSLPGVAAKDIPGAIDLQIEALHPWGDEEVAWGWMPLPAAPDSGHVVVGLVRKALLDSYETLFIEAGVPLAAATFSSAAIHAALRIWGAAPASLLIYQPAEDGRRTEIYGESAARAVYSTESPLPLERALAVARAELRIAPDAAAQSLIESLPAPAASVAGISPLAYAAALAASASLVSRPANLLPPERRASSARRQYLLPAILAALLAVGLIVLFVVYPMLERRSYLAALNVEIRKLEPVAARAQSLDKKAAADRARTATLDDIRRRPQADLDVLNELTRLLPAQVWTSSIEIYPDSVVIAGEADQAAPLLKLLDSSPLFQNSEFALSVTHNAQTEQFRIKSMRRGRAGRTTP